MSKPAARVGDMHVCPKITGNVPHVGGPAIQGSADVFISGMPAARVGDKLVCIGPPDTIKSGSKSVFINGKPAARFGDDTEHGGKITLGSPTVFIGSEPWRGPNEATLPKPPKSKAEVIQRMDAAATKVAAAKATDQPLPPPAYTSEDKLFRVDIGLEEKFIVRLVEARHAGDDGYIGYVPKGATTCTYWSSTYTELEHADSDPELLCKAVGKTYNPEGHYTLLLIDQEKACEVGDMLSFIPTYENLTDFAKVQLADSFEDEEDLIAPVMTEEYSRFYERVYETAGARGVDLGDRDEFNRFVSTMGFDPDKARLLQIRYKFHKNLGANEQFLGNGMTKDNTVNYRETPFGAANPAKHYGPVETFTYDKNPQTLLALEKAGIVTRIPLAPVQGKS